MYFRCKNFKFLQKADLQLLRVSPPFCSPTFRHLFLSFLDYFKPYIKKKIKNSGYQVFQSCTNRSPNLWSLRSGTREAFVPTRIRQLPCSVALWGTLFLLGSCCTFRWLHTKMRDVFGRQLSRRHTSRAEEHSRLLQDSRNIPRGPKWHKRATQ